MPDLDLVERTGLTKIVHQPTRGNNILDRVFVSNPQLFSAVRVVASVVKSDHKTVVAFSDANQCARPKSKTQRTFRPKTPSQHALFLQHVTSVNFENPRPTASSDPSINIQAEFDHFYTISIQLLSQYYPERTIAVTGRDPDFVTPEIAKLRRKNRLMRAGRVEEAGALVERIGNDIKRRSKTRFMKIDGKTGAKDMWTAVRQLTGRQHQQPVVDGVTAESLNDHYALPSPLTPPIPNHPASNPPAPPSLNTFLNGVCSNS